jgi:hypothetical protein
MMIRVYRIKGYIFLIIVRISMIFIFFLARLVRSNVVPPLEPLVSNSEISCSHEISSEVKFNLKNQMFPFKMS